MSTTKISTVDLAVNQRNDILLYENKYGKIFIPRIPHKDRAYGGHLMVSPGQKVHHVHELLNYPGMFFGYHLLCAIAEEAMLKVIPSLKDDKGIINLFEAGNWQLHIDREPIGKVKNASHKSVHAHLYGRSIEEPATNEYELQLHWEWGEAPFFPAFKDTPFSPKREKKNWIVPEQFTEKEIRALKKYIREKANKINWGNLAEVQKHIF